MRMAGPESSGRGDADYVALAYRGDVAVLTLQHPQDANAPSLAMTRALIRTVARVETEGRAHGLVIASAGDVFCSGGSVDDLLSPQAPLEEMYAGFVAVANCRVPTVAAVNGPAVGAGLNLALAADSIVCAPSARFETRFLDVGLHPGGGYPGSCASGSVARARPRWPSSERAWGELRPFSVGWRGAASRRGICWRRPSGWPAGRRGWTLSSWPAPEPPLTKGRAWTTWAARWPSSFRHNAGRWGGRSSPPGSLSSAPGSVGTRHDQTPHVGRWDPSDIICNMELVSGDAGQARAAGRPLEGIRVLAVEQMQALPYATQLLSRFGADVVKIEPITGDLGRASLPAMADPQGRRVGATFLRNNLNKRSMCVDLKQPEGRELVLSLAPKFDVFAENFKSGAMDNLGLGFDALRQVHPTCVYASVSGFGNSTETPYRDWPAFAPIVEAMSGIYEMKRQGDLPPTVSPVGALGDIGAALFVTIGILAALRDRDRHGGAHYVDVAMFDSVIAMTDIVTNFWSMGLKSGELGARDQPRLPCRRRLVRHADLP